MVRPSDDINKFAIMERNMKRTARCCKKREVEKKNNNMWVICLCMLVFMSGCRSSNDSPESFAPNGQAETAYEVSSISEEMQQDLYIYPQGQTFESEIGKEGVFEITVNSSCLFNRWKEAGIPFDELSQSLDSISMIEDTPEEGDLFYEDGSIREGYQFLLLNLTITNKDAVARQMGDIFNLNNLVITERELLESPDPVLKEAKPELLFKTTKYSRITYSSKAAEAVWKVQIPVGETVQVDLGYLVKDYGGETEGHTLIGSDGGDRQTQILFDLGLE